MRNTPHPGRVPSWRAGVCLAVIGWLGGCSVQMAYNNLDRLARWSVNDYVDLDRTQQDYFDARFRELWDWHRREHLPQYAAFLDGVAARLPEGTDDASMRELVEQVVGWADQVEVRAMPMAAELLASLTDEQVRALAAALEESNRELAEPERGAPVEESRERWAEQLVDGFTRFSGRLEPVQKGYVAEMAQRYRPELVLWADYRRRWQKDFLAALVHRHDVDGLEAALRQLAANRTLYFERELTEIDAHNERLARDVSVWLINSSTKRQLERFQDRLGELADDFRQLAAQRDRPAGAAPACLVRC